MAYTFAAVGEAPPRGAATRHTAELANALAVLQLSQILTAPGVITATVTSQVKTANTLTYLINGIFKSKGATDNFWTLGVAGSATVVAASMFQKYVLLIDDAGAATVQEGTAGQTAATVTWTNVANLGPYSPILTMMGPNKAIAGVLTVATAAATTFTPGTTLLGAAGITATYIDGIDVSLLPLITVGANLVIGNGG